MQFHMNNKNFAVSIFANGSRKSENKSLAKITNHTAVHELSV